MRNRRTRGDRRNSLHAKVKQPTHKTNTKRAKKRVARFSGSLLREGVMISLSDIRAKESIQPREEIDSLTVLEYGEAMTRGDKFPAITLFLDGDHYWLGDGFHRYLAAERAKQKKILANVFAGAKREATLFACGANIKHGLRRSNNDKRRAVSILLNDREWRKWSNREIARVSGVDESLVRKIRAELPSSAVKPQIEERLAKRGDQVYAMSTLITSTVSPLSAPSPLAPDVLEILQHSPVIDDRKVIAQIAELPSEMQERVATKLANGDETTVRGAIRDVLIEKQQQVTQKKKRDARATSPHSKTHIPNGAMLINGNSAFLPLRSESVDTIIFSPPYWGPRDYESVLVWGGTLACDHVWGNGRRAPKNQRVTLRDAGQFCRKCGAWAGCLGLEPTPELYTKHLMLLMREAWRVLKPTGTLWINIADSYASVGRNGGAPQWINDYRSLTSYHARPNLKNHPALKDTDLVGVSWRVAFAAQGFAVIAGKELDQIANVLAQARSEKDWALVERVETVLRGWAAISNWIDPYWLRASVIWHKPNALPEGGVNTRPARDFEHIFMLAKSSDYFYDAEAVLQAYKNPMDRWGGDEKKIAESVKPNSPYLSMQRKRNMRPNPDGRQLRSVWTLPTSGYEGLHTAPYPPDLVVPCIKAGSSEHGCCPKCSKPFERIVNRKSDKNKSVAWQPTCECAGTFRVIKNIEDDNGVRRSIRVYVPKGKQLTPTPATVLDLTVGTAATGIPALALGRRFIGVDASFLFLNSDARARLSTAHQWREKLTKDDDGTK